MASSLGTWVGAALVLASALALPGLLGGASGREDLTAEIPGVRFHTLRPDSAAALPAVLVEPSSASLTLGSSGPGLGFMRWTKNYGAAYKRELTWPVLTGPFTDEAAYVCDYDLHLGAELFDVPSQGALSQTLTGMINDRLPLELRHPNLSRPIPIPRARDVVASIQLLNGFAVLKVQIQLVDGTVLSVSDVPLRVAAWRGQLVLQRLGQLRSGQVRFEGPLKEWIVQQAGKAGASKGSFWGALLSGLAAVLAAPITGGASLIVIPVGIGIGAGLGEDKGRNQAEAQIPNTLSQMVSKQLDALVETANTELARLNEPFHPIADRPGDELRLQLAQDPAVTPRGITLPICARIQTSSPRMDDSLRVFSTPPVPDRVASSEPRSDSSVSLSLGSNALGQVAYYLWQSRTLEDLGRSTEVLGAASEHLRQVDFGFDGFSPRLPPTLAAGPLNAPSIQVALGNVRLGTTRAREVMAHGVAGLRVASSGDRVELRATLAAVHLNCVERRAGAILLTPCLADLLPIARERLSAVPLDLSWRGADVLAKLPSLELGDTRLTMSGLRASTTGAPAALELSAAARFE